MTTPTDALLARYQTELDEREQFINNLTAGADGRDLATNEMELITRATERMAFLAGQVEQLGETARIAGDSHRRSSELARQLTSLRNPGSPGAPEPVHYRSAGAYMLDHVDALLGSQSARERLDLFTRAAAHQKTSDNLGIVPDPIVGDLVSFIDAARPIVSFLGARDMPSATWYRPKVTQHTTVAVQGSAGGAADEKAELVSQKMTITRLTGTAVTYGGYVNVSRQNIDFSSPAALDAIINDLAAQYAIQTEAVVGLAIQSIANNVELTTTAGGTPTAAELVAGLWTAAANIYTATKGQGRLALIVPPARLGNWGQTFAPVNPQNAQSSGFSAGSFSQGLMGVISGIPVYVSAGYPVVANHYGSVISSAAVEVYEQRVGALQATEPSVLGVQVAYAGYFTPITIESSGVQRIVNLA